MRRLLIPLMLLLALSSCAQPPMSLDSPHYAVPVASQLVLLKPLAIPPDTASIRLNGDGRFSLWSPDRYRPHCRLEMWTRTAQGRTVEPDTFVVTKVVRDEEYVEHERPVQLAARFGLGLMFGDTDDGGPMARIMTTQMFLHSERQPDVYRLSCGRWDDPVFAEHLTVREIQQALAGIITLTLPQGAPTR